MMYALAADPLLNNLEIVATLFVFVWLFSWSKNALGSPKLAVLFAFIVTYLTVFLFPVLIWVGVVLFLLATFGEEFFEKVNVYKS